MTDFTPTPERQKQILSLLTKQGRLSVAEIVEQFSVSEATARRDLESLASEGKVQRVHGGAIAAEQAPPELPILERESEQADEKIRIGRATAELIADNETVFLGSGTTVLEAAKYLRDRKHLTVISLSPASAFSTGSELVMTVNFFRSRRFFATSSTVVPEPRKIVSPSETNSAVARPMRDFSSDCSPSRWRIGNSGGACSMAITPPCTR